jgi:hypothetical protein
MSLPTIDHSGPISAVFSALAVIPDITITTILIMIPTAHRQETPRVIAQGVAAVPGKAAQVVAAP